MARPRLSVVIPSRERAHTLRFTLRTCVAQAFDDCEILVSDNGGPPATREVVEAMSDPRVRYVRTPGTLAMSDSWDFALSQAAGEYVMVIGDDDGLLLHALPEIDRLLRLLDTPILRWDSVCYTWPDLPAQPYAAPNELLIPLGQVDFYYPIRRRAAPDVISLVLDSGLSYAHLPSLYCSAVHRDMLERLRARTGRLFRSRSPDIYSAFALAQLAGHFFSVSAPMNINALSGRSTGVSQLYLREPSPVGDEFRQLSDDAGYPMHPAVPDLSLMCAMVADSFQHAREALGSDGKLPPLDRKRLAIECLRTASAEDPAEWEALVEKIRRALRDDRALTAWFETTSGSYRPACFPHLSPRPEWRRYGWTYLHLDASEFGIADVWGVADFCERLLGMRREGVNAHLTPDPPPRQRFWDRGRRWLAGRRRPA